MANPSKEKGMRAERAVAEWLKANGHPNAERSRWGWTDDRGDIDGVDDLCVEIKDQKKIDLSEFLKELERETANRKTNFGVLIVKKRLTMDVDEWYAVMPAKAWITLFNLLKEIGGNTAPCETDPI